MAVAERVRWNQVVFYYLLACAISWPFLAWRDLYPESWRGWAVPNWIKIATYMWGPGIAALVTWGVFRRTQPRLITFWGVWWPGPVFIYLVPLMVLALLGALEDDWFPARVIFISFASVFGEELGWRGFLQDALRPLAPVSRFVLIGVLWEFWHFTTRIHQGPVIAIVIRLSLAYVVVIALSWLIGSVVERTRSLLMAHTLHVWVNLAFERPVWSTFLVGVTALGLGAMLLPRWYPKDLSTSRPVRCSGRLGK